MRMISRAGGEVARGVGAVTGLLLATVMLASCGGGTTPATEVRTFVPWAPGGELNADVEQGSVVTGSCFGTASALQRSDAYRCSLDSPASDGSTVADPCFSGPNGKVACIAEPGGEATVVELAAPLPQTDVGDRTAEGSPPWAMTLESGEACSFASGATAAVGSDRLNYFCDDGLTVYGEPDRSDPVWTVKVGREGSSTLTTTGVELAWF
jgi:hypothetical protein